MKLTDSMCWRFPLVLAALLILAQGCSTVPVTGRRQLNLMSTGQEMELGLASFDQIKKETPISKDAGLTAMVQRVGRQVAAVVGSDLPNAQWEFVLFESPEANAFCLPGGKVGVYSGLLPIAKNDAGLATVMSHEVAHAAARHGAERMSEAMVMRTGGQLLGSTLSSADPKWQEVAGLAYGAGVTLGRELPHSRTQELEADHIGVMYMARAGYNPAAAVEFWQRFADYNHQQGGESPAWLGFLRTHPVDEVRIKELQRLLPEAQAEYQRSGGR